MVIRTRHRRTSEVTLRRSHEPADAVRRKRQAALAGHAGDVDTARTLLADEDASVRATALGALARAGGLSAGLLVEAMVDLSPVVRRRSIELAVAADAGPLLAAVPLLPMLADADPSVIEVAAWACGERTSTEPGVVDVLSTLATGHDDALIREAAVAALGLIGDVAGLPAILRATADKATVRRRAVIALAPFAGPEVDDALQRASTDRDWQVRQAAEDLLAE